MRVIPAEGHFMSLFCMLFGTDGLLLTAAADFYSSCVRSAMEGAVSQISALRCWVGSEEKGEVTRMWYRNTL